MTLFQIAGALLTLAALLAFINYRFLKLPTTIGVMTLALAFSLALVGLHEIGPDFDEPVREIVRAIDFQEVLLDVLLAFLLFAGALHVDINDLMDQKWVILTLATLGILASTLLVAVGVYFLIFPLFDVELRFIHALLFGALISPTDPIAVLGLMKRAGVPRSIETKITGESLFNDGVGVVIFLALLGVAFPSLAHEEPETEPVPITSDATLDPIQESHQDIVGYVGELLLVEVGGGLLTGLLAGLAAYQLVKRVDNYKVEILITLALAVGAYALCSAFHMSGPLAVVVAGLLMGNKGRLAGMSDRTRESLDSFWELVDEILNVVLFVLIGMEVLILDFTGWGLLAGALTIPIVLISRALAVFGGVSLLRLTRLRSEFATGANRLLTWAGLRGGISVALALSLPLDSPARDPLLAIAYVVVIFSIVVQGLTVPLVVRKVLGPRPPQELAH